MKLRLNCREVTRTVLQGQDRALMPLEWLQLRLHWLICGGCRQFRRQAALMQQAGGAWRHYRDQSPPDAGRNPPDPPPPA